MPCWASNRVSGALGHRKTSLADKFLSKIGIDFTEDVSSPKSKKWLTMACIMKRCSSETLVKNAAVTTFGIFLAFFFLILGLRMVGSGADLIFILAGSVLAASAATFFFVYFLGRNAD